MRKTIRTIFIITLCAVFFLSGATVSFAQSDPQSNTGNLEASDAESGNESAEPSADAFPESEPSAPPVNSSEPSMDSTVSPTATATVAPTASIAPTESLLEGNQPETPADPAEGVVYEAGEILVQFKENASVLQANDTMAAMSMMPEEQLDEVIDQGDVVVVQLPEELSVQEALEVFAEDPAVEFAQPNYLYRQLESGKEDISALATTINDPYRTDQWYLDSIGAYGAWDIRKTNREVKVAVLDSGISMNHPDLKNNIDKVNAYDEYNDMPLTGDISGHGTHVAGIIAAEANNGIGAAGVSYNASIVPINVFRIDPTQNEPVASTSDIRDAYDRIMNIPNLRVINLSLGIYNAADRVLEQKINQARSKGILTVCAGGNGDSNKQGQAWPVYPSDFEACIAVVPIDQNDQRPTWADYNAQKDIAAPGIRMWSTFQNSYTYMSGSSMAAPVVSAVAAMIFAENPSLTVNEVKNILYTTATDLGEANKDIYYGWGKVNASKALKKAQSNPIPDFVERLYTKAMGRASDSSGKAYWVGELKAKRATGAYVGAAFMLSDEMEKQRLPDGEFLNRMYRTFMDREPDSAGKAFWQGILDEGMSRKYVFGNFLNCPEFKRICGDYGILSGSYASDELRDQNRNVTAFINRLYKECLKRSGDAVGLNFWAGQLLNRASSGGKVAQGFFFSEEFLKANYSNSEYINRLYRVMMDRQPSIAEKNYWLQAMAGGKSRMDVFRGFIYSQEFTNICAYYGIVRGDV